jgi:hypothetical protein
MIQCGVAGLLVVTAHARLGLAALLLVLVARAQESHTTIRVEEARERRIWGLQQAILYYAHITTSRGEDPRPVVDALTSGEDEIEGVWCTRADLAWRPSLPTAPAHRRPRQLSQF